MPVHAHDGAEGLEPERMRQAAQKIVAAVMMDDRLRDHRAKTRHASPEPRRNPAIVQGQIGAAGASGHEASQERIGNMLLAQGGRVASAPSPSRAVIVVTAITDAAVPSCD